MREIEDLTDKEVVAMTAWGENRSHGYIGMQSVTNSMVNRANNPKWWGHDLRSVCLKPMQYSCWNDNDPNRKKMLSVTETDPRYLDALGIAQDALDGTLKDLTDGATHYYASGTPEPKWANGASPSAVLAGHIFFRGIE